MVRIVEQIICETFEKSVGRCQALKEKQKAFEVRFRVSVDHEKEEGYRWLTMRIYAPRNYVAVLTREECRVIPLEGLKYDKDTGESHVKRGYKYDESKSEWKCVSYHDSCWRDGVRQILQENREKIHAVCAFESWYRTVELTEDELEEIENSR